MKSILAAVLIFYIVQISCFDKNLKKSDFIDCQDIRLDGQSEPMIAINSLRNNFPCHNEVLRMKIYATGFDFYFFLKNDNGTTKYTINISGYNRRFCQLIDDSGKVLAQVDCLKLTSDYIYTEFDLLINFGKQTLRNFFWFLKYIYIFLDGTISLFKDGEKEAFMQTTSTDSASISSVSFGRYRKEIVDTYLYFDCPFECNNLDENIIKV